MKNNDADLKLFNQLQERFKLDLTKDSDSGDAIVSFANGTYDICAIEVLWESNQREPRSPQYVVTHYHQTPYSYHNPPETIDTEIGKSLTFWDALQIILQHAIQVEIDGFAQSASEAKLDLMESELQAAIDANGYADITNEN